MKKLIAATAATTYLGVGHLLVRRWVATGWLKWPADAKTIALDHLMWPALAVIIAEEMYADRTDFDE